MALFTVPAHALYFGGYELTSSALARARGSSEAWWQPFVAGVVADVFGALLWCPQDVIKQRLQVQENKRGEVARYRNSWHGLQLVLREDGVRGLYRGFGAAILVYAPLIGLHFMFYERLKRLAAARLDRSLHDLPRWVPLCAALTSSSTAAVLTTPLDVVKTRLQVLSAKEGGYTGVQDALRSMARSEGPSAFFRGAGARMLWLGPNAAIGMAFCASPRLAYCCARSHCALCL